MIELFNDFHTTKTRVHKLLYQYQAKNVWNKKNILPAGLLRHENKNVKETLGASMHS